MTDIKHDDKYTVYRVNPITNKIARMATTGHIVELGGTYSGGVLLDSKAPPWFETPDEAWADYYPHKIKASAIAIKARHHIAGLSKIGAGIVCYTDPYFDIYGTQHYGDAELFVQLTIEQGGYNFLYDIIEMVRTTEAT